MWPLGTWHSPVYKLGAALSNPSDLVKLHSSESSQFVKMASSEVLPNFSTGDSSTLPTDAISIHCQRRGLSSLPSEVHSQIASHFQGNFRMLLTMCLLSRYWRDVSRRYLFVEVKIYNPRRLNTFLALLKCEPRLGGWVDCLTLSSGHPKRNDLPEYPAWFYNFPDMRSKLPTLRTLVLNFPIQLDTFYTRQVFERLATSFGDSVVTVSFYTTLVHFPDLISFTCRLPHLKNVVILGGQALTVTKEMLNPLNENRVSSSQFHLDFLKIDCPPPMRVDLDIFMTWLSSAPFIKTIRVLEIRALWVTNDISSCSSTIGMVLTAIGPALEDLSMYIGIPNASGRGMPTLSFTKLTH